MARCLGLLALAVAESPESVVQRWPFDLAHQRVLFLLRCVQLSFVLLHHLSNDNQGSIFTIFHNYNCMYMYTIIDIMTGYPWIPRN